MDQLASSPLRRDRCRHARPLDRLPPRRRASHARRSARAATSSCSTSRRPGAGATGIACGVVRNNYFQPAMSELMQACVEVWESDPEAYHYNGVGYIALGPKVQEPDLIAVYERHERIGYRSELIVGEAEVDAHMKAPLPRLARPGRDRVPARAPGRLRLQPRVGRGPRATSASPRVCGSTSTPR